MQIAMKWKIKKGDTVEVQVGKDRGKMGKVFKVDKEKQHVWVEKINLLKRHMRRSQKYPQGGILEKEAPLHYSNISLFCPKCNQGVRVGWKKEGKERKCFCKKCQHVFDRK